MSDAVAQAGAELRDGFVVDSALDLIARDGWRGLTMGAIAHAANLSLSDIYKSRASKADILKAFIRRVDLAALDEETGEAAMDAETPRDRLFDSVLLRFETLDRHRDALRVLHAELPRDPVACATILPAVRKSLAWTLEAAGLDSSGLRGAMRVRVLGFICWRTFRVWLDDDGGDLAKTMADLDRRLRRAEGVLGLRDRAERNGDTVRHGQNAPQAADPAADDMLNGDPQAAAG